MIGAAAAPIIGGAGLVQGGKNNKQQQSQANAAGAMGKGIADRLTGLFDTVMNLAKANAPAMSADGQIANLAKDSTFWNNQQQAGTAAAMRTAGYQPGDSEVLNQLKGVSTGNQRTFTQMANAIRVNAPMQQAALYNMANPMALGSAMGFFQQQQQNAYGRMQSPGGFMQSISPFLDPNNFRRGMRTQTTFAPIHNAGNSEDPENPH